MLTRRSGGCSEPFNPLLERGDPVTAVALVEFHLPPIGARNLAPARCRSAPADHPEPVGARRGAVVEGRLLAGDDFTARDKLERSDMPQGRVAAVVPEVDRRFRWEHEVRVVVHRDRVEVRSRRISVRLPHERYELG